MFFPTIMFDLDDTVVVTHPLYREAIWHCGLIITRALGPHAPDPMVLYEWHRTLDEWSLDTAGHALERFPESWVRVYRSLCRRAGIAARPPIERKIIRAALVFTRGPFRPVPGAVGVLTALSRQGRILHLVTAGDPRLQHRKVRELGIERLFRGVHCTPNGTKKAVMASIIAAERGPWMMVGDARGSDILPAIELGIEPVWISHGDPWKPHDLPIDPSRHRTIRTIAELPTLIQQLESAR